MVRHPRACYIVHPSLSLEMVTPENSLDAGIHCARKSASKAVLSRMQLSLETTRPTPHGASRLGQTMCAWSVKPRRTLSRHWRDAMIFGHTAIAMHGMSTPPPCFSCFFLCFVFNVSRSISHLLTAQKVPAVIVIRTHGGPQKPRIPLCLHTISGSDYYPNFPRNSKMRHFCRRGPIRCFVGPIDHRRYYFRGVHTNQDPIWCAKIWLYTFFGVRRGS